MEWVAIILCTLAMGVMIFAKEVKLRETWGSLTLPAKIVWWIVYCSCTYLVAFNLLKIV